MNACFFSRNYRLEYVAGVVGRALREAALLSRSRPLDTKFTGNTRQEQEAIWLFCTLINGKRNLQL